MTRPTSSSAPRDGFVCKQTHLGQLCCQTISWPFSDLSSLHKHVFPSLCQKIALLGRESGFTRVTAPFLPPLPSWGGAWLRLMFVLHRDSDSAVSVSGTWGGSVKVICTQDPEAVREPSPALDGPHWSLYGLDSGADRRDSGSWAPVRSPLRLSFPGDLTLNPREGRMERRRSHVQSHAGCVGSRGQSPLQRAEPHGSRRPLCRGRCARRQPSNGYGPPASARVGAGASGPLSSGWVCLSLPEATWRRESPKVHQLHQAPASPPVKRGQNPAHLAGVFWGLHGIKDTPGPQCLVHGK